MYQQDLPQGVTPPQTYNYSQQPPVPPKKKKTLWIILGVVFALLLCCGAGVVGLVVWGVGEATGPLDTVEQINTALVESDTELWDKYVDSEAVYEYMIPDLVEGIKSGRAYQSMLEEASQEEVDAFLDEMMTVETLLSMMERPLYDDGATEIVSQNQVNIENGIARVETLIDGEEVTIVMEERADGEEEIWVVVGFDSQYYIDTFTQGFDEGFLGE